ncbi:MAG: GntR family transcriptional regulator [Ilumatobacter fluminis]|uniref:GntR family transcriptional regulator n=1 Tax=Ilumatobacter fluminis TaxID=467091 RepID=UPI0032EAB9DC
MSTVDRVQHELMGELLRGELAPGLRLGQDEVADRLGVSKIPVREALQRLAALGLLRFETNRGAFVPRLTVADAVENYALRRALEPKLLERAVDRLSVVDLAEAEQALDDDAGTADTNWRFHRALYRAADWRRGLAMVEILHAAVAPYVVLYTDALGGADDSDDEHARLLDACRRRDAPAALGLLHIHLERAERTLVASLEVG